MHEFVNGKSSSSKFVWYIDVLDELEEEYSPVAGFADSIEEAKAAAEEYLGYYEYASVIIRTITGKPVKGA